MTYFNFREELLFQLIDLLEQSKTYGALKLVLEGLPGEAVTLEFQNADVHCPTISIEELFLRNQYEMLPIRVLASEAFQEFRMAELQKIRLKMDTVKNPMNVKFCAISCKYQKRLEELRLPYSRLGDMCIYYRFHAKENNGKLVYNMPVEAEDLKLWGLHVDDLKEIVARFSGAQCEVIIKPIAAVIQENLESFFMLGRTFVPKERASAWILTGPGGAAGIFYKDILDEFAEGVNTDLYLLPTTVGETWIYAADTYTPADIQMRLAGKKTINGLLNHPLSEAVLHYSLKTKRLTVNQTTLVRSERGERNVRL